MQRLISNIALIFFIFAIILRYNDLMAMRCYKPKSLKCITLLSLASSSSPKRFNLSPEYQIAITILQLNQLSFVEATKYALSKYAGAHATIKDLKLLSKALPQVISPKDVQQLVKAVPTLGLLSAIEIFIDCIGTDILKEDIYERSRTILQEAINLGSISLVQRMLNLYAQNEKKLPKNIALTLKQLLIDLHNAEGYFSRISHFDTSDDKLIKEIIDILIKSTNKKLILSTLVNKPNEDAERFDSWLEDHIDGYEEHQLNPLEQKKLNLMLFVNNKLKEKQRK